MTLKTPRPPHWAPPLLPMLLVLALAACTTPPTLRLHNIVNIAVVLYVVDDRSRRRLVLKTLHIVIKHARSQRVLEVSVVHFPAPTEIRTEVVTRLEIMI